MSDSYDLDVGMESLDLVTFWTCFLPSHHERCTVTHEGLRSLLGVECVQRLTYQYTLCRFTIYAADTELVWHSIALAGQNFSNEPWFVITGTW